MVEALCTHWKLYGGKRVSQAPAQHRWCLHPLFQISLTLWIGRSLQQTLLPRRWCKTMLPLLLQRARISRCRKSHAIAAQRQTSSMTYIIIVASAAKKGSIFALTVIELVEAATTGLALAGWLGTSTSVLRHQKATRRITSSHTFYQREDTHDQALLANHAMSKRALFANGALLSQMLATGTATSVSKEPGDIALHVSTKDNTAHTHSFQLLARIQLQPIPSRLQIRQSACHICLRIAMRRCLYVKTATSVTIPLHLPTHASTAIRATMATTMSATNATTALSPPARFHKLMAQTGGEDV
jgi:hypothetical protein